MKKNKKQNKMANIPEFKTDYLENILKQAQNAINIGKNPFQNNNKEEINNIMKRMEEDSENPKIAQYTDLTTKTYNMTEEQIAEYAFQYNQAKNPDVKLEKYISKEID